MKTMADLVALAKKEPGKYSYAGMSIGFGQLTAERFFRLGLKVDMVRVPFQGAAPLINSTIGGHTPVAFIALPPAIPLIKEGKLRALAVTGTKRSPDLPDVPTTARPACLVRSPTSARACRTGRHAEANRRTAAEEVAGMVGASRRQAEAEHAGLHAGRQHVRGLCGPDQVRSRNLERGRQGTRHHGAVRLYGFGLASALARMPSSVSPGVEALVSTLRWMIDGLPDFSQARNAAAKSAVFSTVTPKPPNALA